MGQIEGVVLDLSGVLYQGNEALPGAQASLAELRQLGVDLRCVTNTTRRTHADLLEKLRGLGLEVDDRELITAARATRSLLEERGLTPLLVIHPELEPEFADLATGEPDAVLVADAGQRFTYQLLNRAFRLLMEGAPLLAVNRNRYFRDGEALSLDAGPFVAALEYAAGVEAEVIGKPEAALFHAATDSMGREAKACVMIGDDVESDVNGALDAGLQALLVRTGKYRDGDAERMAAGARVVDDIREAVRWVRERR